MPPPNSPRTKNAWGIFPNLFAWIKATRVQAGLSQNLLPEAKLSAPGSKLCDPNVRILSLLSNALVRRNSSKIRSTRHVMGRNQLLVPSRSTADCLIGEGLPRFRFIRVVWAASRPTTSLLTPHKDRAVTQASYTHTQYQLSLANYGLGRVCVTTVVARNCTPGRGLRLVNYPE